MVGEEGEYIRASDFFKNSRHITVSEDVRREIEEEDFNRVGPPEHVRRRAEDWSILAHQVVGGEVPYKP